MMHEEETTYKVTNLRKGWNRREHPQPVTSFEEYMLYGPATSNNTKRTATTTRTNLAETSTPTGVLEVRPKKIMAMRRRLQRSMEQSFRDWLTSDDQLLAVVKSIANLRHRIWLSSRALLRRQQHQQQQQQQRQRCRPQQQPQLHRRLHNIKEHDVSLQTEYCRSAATLETHRFGWKQYGFRRRNDDDDEQGEQALPEQVLQLTLSDELIQHERMLALLRQVLSQLSLELDTIGRRFDNWMRCWKLINPIHLNPLKRQQPHYHDSEVSSMMEANSNPFFTATEASSLLLLWQGIIRACAQELYRKQSLAQVLLEATVVNTLLCSKDCHDDSIDSMTTANVTTTDAIVASFPFTSTTNNTKEYNEENNDIDIRRNESPRHYAQRCTKLWPRSAPESHMLAFQDFINNHIYTLPNSHGRL